jgi:hypothetical protein
MAAQNSGPATLLHAYRLLDVPVSATAHLIRHRHRQLLKRWHPDLYADGTPQHAEATQMSKVINEAYSRIQYAPLRYRAPSKQSVKAASESRMGNEPSAFDFDSDENYPRLDRIEFWVRAGWGALLGGFVSLEIIFYTYDWPQTRVILICIGVTAGCIAASARLGDKFWKSVLNLWWLEP